MLARLVRAALQAPGSLHDAAPVGITKALALPCGNPDGAGAGGA
jgi:hypothetical protein